MLVICKNISNVPLRLTGEKTPPGGVFEIERDSGVDKFEKLGHLVVLASINGDEIDISGRKFKIQRAAATASEPVKNGKAFTR